MIIPAILEKDWSEIERKLEICREFANTIHIDFIDGKFAPPTTFMDFEKFKPCSEYFLLEAHLMVEEPVNDLASFSRAGFKRFLGHVEKMSDQIDFSAKGEQLGAVGLALDLQSSIDAIKVSLNDLDQILLMSVKAGASGQKFDESVLIKVKELVDKSFENIEIDGGINNETLGISKRNGANIFCVNSYLFSSPSVEDQYRKLQAFI